jgi:cytochrome c oxidase cbb3-type subunit 4
MQLFSVIGTITTVISFFVFLGIVLWAYSKRRQPAFAEAANAPFALPDEGHADDAARSKNPTERQS